jgi:hypothetical protein
MSDRIITYPSQYTYEGGKLMCTSVAYAWLLGCFRGMPPACAEQEMEGIMCQALHDHSHVCSQASGLSEAGPLRMLSSIDMYNNDVGKRFMK